MKMGDVPDIMTRSRWLMQNLNTQKDHQYRTSMLLKEAFLDMRNYLFPRKEAFKLRAKKRQVKVGNFRRVVAGVSGLK